MRIIIKTKNLDLTDELKNFIETRIGSIKKFIDFLKDESERGKTLAEVFVEVEKETEHHKNGKIFAVKVQVRLLGKSLIAYYKSDDLLKAVGGAKDELKAEIEKYKLKNIDRNRREQRRSKKEIEV